MDLQIKDEKLLEAIFHLVLQNNFQLRAISTALIEYIGETDDAKANKFTEIYNKLLVDSHEHVVLELKRLYDDLGDVDINDAIK